MTDPNLPQTLTENTQRKLNNPISKQNQFEFYMTDEEVLPKERASNISKTENFAYIQKLDDKENNIPLQPPITYVPYQIPPDFDQAELHGLACRVGPEIECKENKKKDICECCARAVQRKALPINFNIKELSFLGSGYTLFFEFLKYSILFLVLLFCVSGGFNFITNYWFGNEQQSSQIEDEGEYSHWSVQFSLNNKRKKEELMELQEILNMVTVLAVIVLLQLFRTSQRQTDNDCDEQDVAANDYTIMVGDIPKDFDAINDDYDDELKLFFDNILEGEKYEVKHVNLCYEINDLKQIQLQIQQALNNKKKHLLYKQQKGKFKEGITLDQLDLDIYNLEQKYDGLQGFYVDGKGREFMKKHFAGWAFVSFDQESIKEKVIDLFNDHSNKNNNVLKFKDHKLHVVQAPYPTDVFWENLQFSKGQRNKFLFQSYFLTSIILLICFGLVALMLYGQKHVIANEGSKSTIQIISISISLVISGLNVVLEILLEYVTQIEKCYTRTDFKISFAKKLAVAQFIITALITFIVEILYQDGKSFKEKIFGEGGIALNQIYVFISNCVIPTLIQAAFAKHYIKQGQKKMEQLKGNKSLKTQEELNQIFEDTPFEIELYYAGVLKTMYLVAFYSPIIPMGILISILGIVMFYWINKYNVVRRCSINFSLSAELSIEMTEMIEYFLPIYSIACLIFQYLIFESLDKISVFTYIGITIGIVHAFLPMQEWNEKLFKIREAPPNKQTYDEVVYTFQNHYPLENPATGKQEKKDFCFKKLMLQYNVDVDKIMDEKADQINNQKQKYEDLKNQILYTCNSDSSDSASQVSKTDQQGTQHQFLQIVEQTKSEDEDSKNNTPSAKMQQIDQVIENNNNQIMVSSADKLVCINVNRKKSHDIMKNQSDFPISNTPVRKDSPLWKDNENHLRLNWTDMIKQKPHTETYFSQQKKQQFEQKIDKEYSHSDKKKQQTQYEFPQINEYKDKQDSDSESESPHKVEQIIKQQKEMQRKQQQQQQQQNIIIIQNLDNSDQNSLKQQNKDNIKINDDHRLCFKNIKRTNEMTTKFTTGHINTEEDSSKHFYISPQITNELKLNKTQELYIDDEMAKSHDKFSLQIGVENKQNYLNSYVDCVLPSINIEGDKQLYQINNSEFTLESLKSIKYVNEIQIEQDEQEKQ